MSVLAQTLPFEAPPLVAALVPTWPRIVATVGVEDLCQVAIDGTVHQMDDVPTAQARAAILALVREQAQDLGRTVRMDTIGPEGAGQVLITPQGSIEDAGSDTSPTHDHPDQAPVAPADQSPAPAPQTLTGAERWSLLVPAPTQPQAPAEPQHDQSPTAPAPPAPPVRAERASPPPPPQATIPPASPAPPAPPSLDQHTDATAETTSASAPTLADLLGGRTTTRPAPAQHGWRAGLRAITGGAISPRPGRAELAQREAAATIARHLDGPKTVVVVNPKGGAHKTTAALLLAANLGIERGGYTLAWDNNETRGTMGWRAAQGAHTRTAIDLLADLERFEARGARVGDLDAYVRAQTWGHFDVLASDEDANSADLVDGPAFERLHATLARIYRVMVIDTGNNMRAPNWSAALAAADQLVIVSTIREDTSQSAAWLADALHATGHGDLVTSAVTVLTAPARNSDPALATRLHQHFSHLTRTVISVPHDPALIAGGPIDYRALTPASRDAWLRVTAAVTDGL